MMKTSWIYDQIIIPKSVSPFSQNDLMISRGFNFLHWLLHIFGSKKLAMLQIHYFSRLRNANNQCGLHT